MASTAVLIDRHDDPASFKDHGEPTPDLPIECPFTIDDLVNESRDYEDMLGGIIRHLPRSDE